MELDLNFSSPLPTTTEAKDGPGVKPAKEWLRDGSTRGSIIAENGLGPKMEVQRKGEDFAEMGPGRKEPQIFPKMAWGGKWKIFYPKLL